MKREISNLTGEGRTIANGGLVEILRGQAISCCRWHGTLLCNCWNANFPDDRKQLDH